MGRSDKAPRLNTQTSRVTVTYKDHDKGISRRGQTTFRMDHRLARMEAKLDQALKYRPLSEDFDLGALGNITKPCHPLAHTNSGAGKSGKLRLNTLLCLSAHLKGLGALSAVYPVIEAD